MDHRYQRVCVAGCFAVFLVGTWAVRGAVISSTMVNPANGHIYHHIVGTVSGENPLGGLSWTEANDFADSLGEAGSAHLVSISDPVEEQWIKNSFRAPEMDFQSTLNLFWTGLSDSEAEGDYVWESGEPVSYLNWTGGIAPTFMAEAEDFVYLSNTKLLEPLMISGQINDHADERSLSGVIPFSAIIEVIPEPTAVFLLPLGFLGLLRRRKSSSN